MAELVVIDRPSPNHGPRADGAPIDILLLHYTGMPDGAAALARMCNPAAEVSAHYMVEEDGTVYRLVEEARRAWHAGVACWAGERDVNSRSIGIELVNPGHEVGYRPFPEPQMAALETLAADILARHPAIVPARVLGHSDVAPTRKTDPGELFDWRRLAAVGIGLWPADDRPAESALPSDIGAAQRMLVRYGYEVAPSGKLDAATVRVIEAFQRHFRPSRVNGALDHETRQRLTALLAAVG